MNRATELGQFEKGEDFSPTTVPTLGETLEVDARETPSGLELTPSNQPEQSGRSMELRHTEMDLLMAQLTETPQPEYMLPNVGKIVTSPSRMAKIQSRNRNREELVWYGIRPKFQMAALDVPQGSNGRVVIRQDTTESEYSCTECHGKGHTDVECPACRGTSKRSGIDCNACQVLGYGFDNKHPSGRTPCSACRGSGWRAGIVIPEVAQGEPVAGIIVSLSPGTHTVKLGDRVLYTKYAGIGLNTPEHQTIRSMRESEIIALIREIP